MSTKRGRKDPVGRAGVGGSTRRKQRRQVTETLTRLAQRIKREHVLVEQAQYDSLSHARKAGELLNDVKAQLEHGKFMPWVEQHCFAQSTANLYMKVAREWDRLTERLTDSQRVGNISLRKAVQLLYEPLDSPASGDGPLSQEAGELFALGILEPIDLEGLSDIQAKTLVTEVREAESEFCDERWQARFANSPVEEHPALEERKGKVPLLVDRRIMRALAQDAAQKLREGKVGYPAVRRLVQPYLRLASGVPIPGKGGRILNQIPSPAGKGIELPELPITQVGGLFYTEAMTLVQEHHVGKRISTVERDAIYIICREVRKAVEAVETMLGEAADKRRQAVADAEPKVAPEPDEQTSDEVNVGEPELVAVE